MRQVVYFFMLCSSLFALDISAKYKVSFGIVGEIGIGYTRFVVDEQNNYTISVHAKSTGIASFLSGEREDLYESVGRVREDGVLIPSYYQKSVQRYTNIDDRLVLKKDIRKYTFFHETKSLHVKITKSLDDEVSYEENEGDYYAPNDLLSLFFNFKIMLPSLDVKEPSKFYAIGVNKTDGKIDVYPLDSVYMKKEFDWKDGHMMKIIINEDIFTHDNDGELLVNLDKNGLLIQALLKDVFFFGDIRGELIE